MEVILLLIMLTNEGPTSQQIKFDNVDECNKNKTVFENKSYPGKMSFYYDVKYVAECIITKNKI